MTENNVRELREKVKLSQRELATKVGTSQQQIQRIEAGVQAVRLDLAVDICKALNAALAEVFPQAALPVARANKRVSEHDHPLVRLYEDEASAKELEEAGFDMALERWTFRFALRNGFEADLPISGPDYRYLWSRVQDRERRNFLVFDSGDYRFAINGDHLLFCHFRFDAHKVEWKEQPSDPHARVYLASREKPFEFDLDFTEDDEKEDIDHPSEWQNIFGHLNCLSEVLEDNEVDRISFLDRDGERAFFNADEIALVQVSLAAVEARVAAAMMRAHEEEAAANASKASSETPQQKVDEPGRTGQLVRIDPSLPAQRVDEDFGYPRTRLGDDWAAAEELLRGLNFQTEVRDNVVTYKLCHEHFTVLADPRKSGRIEFCVFDSERTERGTIERFYVMDWDRRDIASKFRQGLSKACSRFARKSARALAARKRHPSTPPAVE
jgi:DNA-binding XRE family transcriptional regulator